MSKAQQRVLIDLVFKVGNLIFCWDSLGWSSFKSEWSLQMIFQCLSRFWMEVLILAYQ